MALQTFLYLFWKRVIFFQSGNKVELTNLKINTDNPEHNVQNNGEHNGKCCREGKITYKNGNIFEGIIDITHTVIPKVTYMKGTLISANNTVVVGEWKDDILTGNDCKIIYPDGDNYSGSIVKGQFDTGMLISEGYMFNGHWGNNARNFSGTIKYPNGDIYEGTYTNSKRNGYGTLIQGNISYYAYSNNDLKNGDGYISINGVKTNKSWKNNLDVERPIQINCPECCKKLNFMLSECTIFESNRRVDEICKICMKNVCNINLPCQHRYCDTCIKLIR